MGGALAIFISQEDDTQNINLSDDGTGAGIRIPVMLLSKEQGNNLKTLVNNSTEQI